MGNTKSLQNNKYLKFLTIVILLSIVLFSVQANPYDVKFNWLIISIGFVGITIVSYTTRFERLSRFLFLINTGISLYGAAFLSNMSLRKLLYPNSGLYIDDNGVSHGVQSYDFMGDIFIGLLCAIFIVGLYSYKVRNNRKNEILILSCITLSLVYLISICRY